MNFTSNVPFKCMNSVDLDMLGAKSLNSLDACFEFQVKRCTRVSEHYMLGGKGWDELPHEMRIYT